jgi:hypothetical protein
MIYSTPDGANQPEKATMEITATNKMKISALNVNKT